MCLVRRSENEIRYERAVGTHQAIAAAARQASCNERPQRARLMRKTSPQRGDVATCPICSNPLEPCSTDHGIVWVCRACRAFAANLAVIRKVAPRQFVKYLWLAALEMGRPSSQPCPSCAQPLLCFGPEVELSPSCKVCCRCFLLWFDEAALTSLRIERRNAGSGRDARRLAFRAVSRVADALDGVVP